MTRVPWFACLAAVVACYSPTTEAPCTVTCDFAGDKLCPAGLTCGPGGMCGTEASSCAACFGQPDGLLQVCLAARPTGTFDVGSNMQVDTTPGITDACITYPQPGSGALDVCLIAAETISIEAKLSVIGSRPLVLLASGALTFEATGAIDAAADNNRAAPAGPGGPGASEPCEAGATGTGNADGGAGGSFGTAGAAGGIGLTGATPNGPGPVIGTLDHVRAGCVGGPYNDPPTPGGAAGGAVYLIAGRSMAIAGSINVSGAGGADLSGANVGGAGGGAGGLIGLDAPALALRGTLMANGGGGACGRHHSGDDPCPGQAPALPATSSSPFVPAAGGSANGYASDGGTGATDVPASPGSPGGVAADSAHFGGAGGGGAAGIIWLATGGTPPNVSAIRMSPQPFPHP